MKFSWETIHSEDQPMIGTTTARANVPGGWLLLTVITTIKGTVSNMVFIPDQNHEWSVD